ncbi:hypothetical protein [Bradyrhizobium sp. ORS 86]|uniref:hypothetical protein n=1 Tax=Bradyrhizobium sp. ORS 86 TaxID=1685970 RepID=UPI00388D1D09
MKVEPWHRRQAIHIAAALPERDEDALIVLRLATELVTGFLAATEQPAKPATVVLIGSGERA